MPTAARLLVIGLVALLTLAAVGVVALRWRGSDPDASPSIGPAGSASTAPSATPAESQSEDPSAAFAEIERQVLDLRGLPAPEIGPAEIIDRQQLAEELVELLEEEWTPEELRRSNLTLQAMGLLTPEQDLRELSQTLLSEQVIGFYDPAEERMVVVSDEGLSVIARITYAHEYTHALQDGAFSSFDARDALTDDDAILARQALEEGDASVVMFQWALQNLSPQELQEVGATPVPDTGDVPDWMIRQLEFPYLSGLAFVSALRASSDGWAAVNDAYTDAPASTEQILHPEKDLAGEGPLEVEALELAAPLGDGWEDLDPTTMGEAMIGIWLTELGAAETEATGAAAGWGGDRLTVAAGPDGEWTMAWRIAWDSAADADEFATAYEPLEPGGQIASGLVRASATETLVLHASSAEGLAALVARFE